MKNHRVGHVGHMELIKADQLVTLGDAPAQLVQRIHRALQLAQFAVHLAHELVKVQARLALERHRVEETIHQEAFAPAHAAEHVHAARNLGLDEELFERVGTALFVFRPLGSITVAVVP